MKKIIFLCIIILFTIGYFYVYLNSEHFNIIQGYNPYVYPRYITVNDKFPLAITNNTGNIHKWEKRFPHLVNQRYIFNDKYPNICDNGEFIFKENDVDLSNKAKLTNLPLKLNNNYIFYKINKNKLKNDYYVNIAGYNDGVNKYGNIKSRNIDYSTYEPTYFDYLDVIL
jgi:hypothetical protein